MPTNKQGYKIIKTKQNTNTFLLHIALPASKKVSLKFIINQELELTFVALFGVLLLLFLVLFHSAAIDVKILFTGALFVSILFIRNIMNLVIVLKNEKKEKKLFFITIYILK